MQPTHFLYLVRPIRPTLLFDMTPEEQAILGRHQQWLGGLLESGGLLLAGPALDGAFGVGVFEYTSPEAMAAIAAEDPAVTGGLFKPETHPIHAGVLASALRRG